MTAPTVAPVRQPRHVKLVSGKLAQVQTQDEADWFEATRDAYLEQLRFTEKTDLIDLDRLLIHELMIFRWTQYSTAGTDYDGDLIDEKRVTTDIKAYSDQINKIKDSMGLNKKARDLAAAEGDFSQWIADLKQRAKIFGVHRERQLTKALTLVQELHSIVGVFDRSDADERGRIGFESEKDIVKWIRETMLPEFDIIDQHFQENEQRYWIRDQ
jgi:hypothetical protein